MDHPPPPSHHRHIPLPLFGGATTPAATSLSSWPFVWEPEPRPPPPPPSQFSTNFLEPVPEYHSNCAELRQALLRATAELESTRAAAHEELRRMEGQALHLAQLLDAATRERDDLRRHCRALLLLLVADHPNRSPPPLLSPLPNPRVNPGPTDLQPPAVDEGSNVAAAGTEEEQEEEGSNGASPPPVSVDAELEAAAARRGLPEKGRLVEAVVAAGPLLETLLLAGPLPLWRHSPPAMQGVEVPPFDPRKEQGEAEAAPQMARCEGLASPTAGNLRNSASPESNCSGRRNPSSFHL